MGELPPSADCAAASLENTSWEVPLAGQCIPTSCAVVRTLCLHLREGSLPQRCPASGFGYGSLQILRSRRWTAVTDVQDLRGRVALVTGGGSGLGRATSLELATCGAHVLIADVNVDGAGETRRAIEESGADGSAEVVHLDVTDRHRVDQVISEAAAVHGDRFDCLVNNAGTDRGADLVDVDDAQWLGVFAVNVHGPMYLSRAFVRHVQAQGRHQRRPADVVCVVSISALTVGAGAGAYNASKAALLKLTEVMQTEARERDWPVRVSAINPAAMNTPMMDQWGLPDERMMPPAVVARIIRTAITLPPEVVLQSVVVTTRNEMFPR
jgi:NAD(P)-dependent dehydrogenase (short-subunit alcohol dehydrogenase family)